MSEPAPPHALLRPAIAIPFIIITLIWGSTWFVIKDQLMTVPPSWSVTYRFTLAGVATLAWAAARGDGLRLDRRGWSLAAAVGLLQFCFNFNFVYRAEQHITSGLVAVVFALLLVPNAILARIFLGTHATRRFMAGSAVAIAGVALLFIHEARAAASGPEEVLFGIAITLGGVLCASGANVIQATQAARSYPLSTTLGWAMLIGAAIDGLFSWATAGPPVFDPRPAYLAGLLYLALAGTALSFSLYFALIRQIGPARAAYTSVLIPVIAMVFSTVLEGYDWSLLAFVGAGLVLAGLVLAMRARNPSR
jgi:drug/metabolite transporter (DMT)-like permease